MYFEIPEAIHELSLAVVCGVVAVAEQRDDRLRGIALESLAELRKCTIFTLEISSFSR